MAFDIARVRAGRSPWSVGIIGAGIVGLATAKALQRRGIEYDIFEPGAPGGGQSRGGSRILWYEQGDPGIATLAVESMSLWEAWEQEFGVELISRRGVVSFGEGSSAGDARELSAAELGRLLPTLDPVDVPASIDPAGATIWSGLAVGNLLCSTGHTLIPRRVETLELLSDDRVAVNAGEIRQVYDSVVVAAGVSTPELAAPLEVELPVTRRARVRTIHAAQPEFAGVGVPGFRGLRHRGQLVDGSPLRGYDRYVIGFGGDLETDRGGVIDPEAITRRTAEVSSWVADSMPGLTAKSSRVLSCWVTELPWGSDGIAIWRRGPVLFPAGGNIFRFAPAVGEVLAEAAEGRPVRADLRPENRLGESRPGLAAQ